MKKKIAFEAVYVDVDGVETVRKLAVRVPSARVRTDAKLHSMAAYNEALDLGIKPKEAMEPLIRRMELWDDEKEQFFQALRAILIKNQDVILKGGVKKSEGREAAIISRGVRGQIDELLSARKLIEQRSADAVAERAMFDYLVAYCTSYDDDSVTPRPYFTVDDSNPSLDAFKEREYEADGQAAIEAFAVIYHGESPDFPEDAFLKKYGFADEKGRLIDKQGRFVDGMGRLVDEEGYVLPGDVAHSEFVEFLDDDEETPAEPAAEPEDEGEAEEEG